MANPDALVEEWDSIRSILAKILSDHYKINVHTPWAQDVHEILLLLRLFPLKNMGRNLGTVASFNRATEKLFLFKKVRFCKHIICATQTNKFRALNLIILGRRCNQCIGKKRQQISAHHCCRRK